MKSCSWEYKLEKINLAYIVEVLDERGAQGWELVTTIEKQLKIVTLSRYGLADIHPSLRSTTTRNHRKEEFTNGYKF